MSVRRKIWSIGLVTTAALVLIVGWEAAYRELTLPLALLGFALCALIAEASVLRTLVHRPSRPSPPEGARLPDGVVDVVPMTGVEALANVVNPNYQRFVRLIDGEREPSKDSGLATMTPTLLGRIVVISVFVGRDGGTWTDFEIARSMEGLIRAGLWIEREGSRREAPVNIGVADTYFRVEDDSIDLVEVGFEAEGDDFGPMEANASTKAVVVATRAAAQLGFAEVVDLMGRINPRVQADQRVWLFHIRRAGRSLAIPASECDVFGVGLAICFAREASFPEPLAGPGRIDPTTVAHELLHLFGASDKYGVSLRSFPPGSVTSRDIMRLNHDSLFRMTIDPLTATEIGWACRFLDRTSNKNARG